MADLRPEVVVMGMIVTVEVGVLVTGVMGPHPVGIGETSLSAIEVLPALTLPLIPMLQDRKGVMGDLRSPMHMGAMAEEPSLFGPIKR